MSSDGSDSAGGVGNDGPSSADTQNSTDSLGDIADSLGDIAQGINDAVNGALGSMADATGLSDALGNVADALGLDAQDLQGLVGAAIMGAITGGLPGAIMGVVNALVGGSLQNAARDAISANVPAALQPLANMMLDKVIGQIPGAKASANPLDAISTLATGALTNGRVPGLDDLSAVARDLRSLTEAGRGLVDGFTSGNPEQALDAVQALDGNLSHAVDLAREITANVTESVRDGNGIHANGGYGTYGDVVEAFAVSTARMMLAR